MHINIYIYIYIESGCGYLGADNAPHFIAPLLFVLCPCGKKSFRVKLLASEPATLQQ